MWTWAVVAPISFALIAWRYRRLENQVGVRTARRTFVGLAVGALLSLVVLPVLMLPLGIPYAAVGLALLVVALRQRSPHLAVGAIVLGLGGLLESLFVLSNRIHEVAGTYVTWANAASWTLLAALMVAITVAAQRYEDHT